MFAAKLWNFFSNILDIPSFKQENLLLLPKIMYKQF